MKRIKRIPRKVKKKAVILQGLRNRRRRIQGGVLKITAPYLSEQEKAKLMEKWQQCKGQLIILSANNEVEIKYTPLPPIKTLHIFNR